MPNAGGLRRKIWIAFILQMTAISFAAVLGVYAAATVIEDVLVKRILKHDADYFFDRARKRSRGAATGYVFRARLSRAARRRSGDRARAVAHSRAGLSPRERAARASSTSPIRRKGAFISASTRRARTAWCWCSGSRSAASSSLIVYLTTWMTYRASRRALSPVIALANAVRDWDPKRPDLDALLPENLPVRADGDVESLAYALHGFATRLEEFVERERAFTRDASHELRTPLTVIKASADMLTDEDSPPFTRRAAERILRSVRDMESLIESFLILARESDAGLPEEEFSVNDAVRAEIESAEPLCAGKPVHIVREERAELVLYSSPRAFSVLIGNLIRNACQYTDHGRVTVAVESDRVVVRDTGSGMSEQELKRAFVSFFRGGQGRGGGHGIGLTIVKRLADRFGWEVGMSSEQGVGTIVTVTFPETQRL